MADDRRMEAIARAILDGPLECLGSGSDLHDTVCSVIAAHDTVDPLRALLADEDRLWELAARVEYAGHRVDAVSGGESAEKWPTWEDAPEATRQFWRGQTLFRCGYFLAALRKEADRG